MTADVAPEMPIPGGVENSSKRTVAKQGMPKQNVDCKGKLTLFAGDSVGHTALSSKKNEAKLRLKGGANKKIKTFISKVEFLKEALTVLRSCNIFMLFKDHKKCPVKSSCNFCLLRSTILKANLKSGRQAVTPVEMECQNFKELSVEMMLEAIFVNAACSMKEFSAALYQEWKCSCCKNYMNGEEYLIYLEEDCGNKNIGNLLKKNMNLSSNNTK